MAANNGNTPKKCSRTEDICFLCKETFASNKEKIRVLGKSSVDIASLILSSTKADVRVFVESERLAICRAKCYNRLVKYQNSMRKTEEIVAEIKREFKADDSVRVKRLAKEEGRLPEAKKSLKFGDTASACEISPASHQASVNPIFVSPKPGIVVATLPKPPLFSFSAVSPIPVRGFQNSDLFQRAFGSCFRGGQLTSTPNKPGNEAQESSMNETRETQIHVSATYPCGKTYREELKGDLSALGKALVHGPNQRIANAVLKSNILQQIIVEKVLKLMTIQLNELCSRKRPSVLRANSKEDLMNFDLEKVCDEMKARAPIFYAFLVASASVKKETPEWLPSVAVAGSVLLKQRNSHMNGCATLIGILLKSRSLEVRPDKD